MDALRLGCSGPTIDELGRAFLTLPMNSASRPRPHRPAIVALTIFLLVAVGCTGLLQNLGARWVTRQIATEFNLDEAQTVATRAAVDEGRALLAHFAADHTVGVSGYSMGGNIAALIGASIPWLPALAAKVYSDQGQRDLAITHPVAEEVVDSG